MTHRILFVLLILTVGWHTFAQNEDNLIQNPSAEDPLSDDWVVIKGDWQRG